MDSHVKVRNGHVLNLSGKLVIGWLTSINAINLLVELHKCSVNINSPSIHVIRKDQDFFLGRGLKVAACNLQIYMTRKQLKNAQCTIIIL